MRVLVLGVGKSGTTALLHKLAASLPDARAYSGGRPGSHPMGHRNAVFKHTVNDAKGRTLDLYRGHLASTSYDKMIWLARDPRDCAVSELLYRWYAGLGKERRQRDTCLSLVRAKEHDPGSVPFHRLYCLTGDAGGPELLSQMIARVRDSQLRLTEFVADLGSDWCVFRYEDMVDGRFEALGDYLGAPVAAAAEIPRSEWRIARRKSYGDWRHWFTEEDCELFRPLLGPYLDLLGYGSDDWALSPNPEIDPRYASHYIERIARPDPLDRLRRLRRRVEKPARRYLEALLH